MAGKPKRVVSLLPSTTEIVCALGMESKLVGRSHECDYPAHVQRLPWCTEPKFDPDGTSYQIDQRVKALLQEGLSVYRVDAAKLAHLRPDVILTQDHCEVCAVSFSEVEQAVRRDLGYDVQIVSVSPTSLSGVLQSILQISQALGVDRQGKALVTHMKSQLQLLAEQTANLPRRKVLCIEWLDPLMVAGNWVPELTKRAGGTALGAEAGTHSPWVKWEDISAMDSDVIAVVPCGYPIRQTQQELRTLTGLKGWNRLQAVQNEKVFLLEGNQYFNRPGPRLVDSAQIMSEILHPEVFPPTYRSKGWINLYQQSQHRTGNG